MKKAFIKGKIYTLNNNNDIAQAFVIEGQHVTFVGSSEEIINSKIFYDKIFDLSGNIVLPGFIDSHTHIAQTSMASLWVDLFDSKSKNEILNLLKEKIKKTKKNNWIVGMGYDDSVWENKEIITKDDLDKLSAEHPIFLRRICGHYGVVNSLALSCLNSFGENFLGTHLSLGSDLRFVDKKTGILKEDSVLAFLKIIKPKQNDRIKALTTYIPNVFLHGVTAIREVLSFENISDYYYLDQNDKLKLRVFGYIKIEDLDKYSKKYPNGLTNNKNFKIVGVKIFLDGSFGAKTAALDEPYEDDPKNYGNLLYTDKDLKQIFQKLKKTNLSLMVHAIGQRAIRQFIEIYSEVFYDKISQNFKKHTLEHVELVDDKILTDIKKLGIWASLQPNFAGRWSIPGAMNEQRLGKTRLKKCNPYKIFFDKVIPVVFGSDCMPLDPLFGIKSAIFHPIKAQGISSNQAIYAYTKNCCKFLNVDSQLGTLEKGKFADFIVLSADPFKAKVKMNETDFDKIKVVGTFINGKRV